MIDILRRCRIAPDLDVGTIDKNTESSALVRELNTLTALCFGKEVPLAETEERFVHSDVVQLLLHGKEVVGYAFNDRLQLVGHPVNYFSSCFVHPFHRGGVYVPFNHARYKEIPVDVVLTRTQNPRVYAGFARFCQEGDFVLYPNATGEVGEESRAIANAFAPGCGDDQVCRGIYGRELMADTPKADGSIAQLFESLVPEQGDAMVLVGIKKN
ncbi:hypothetical protein J4210_04925 [Candidatus Woesearchaeota archaeon]|nr:hypothetical protein [Candidatus Woesearchaeota archaeon]